MLRWAKIYQRLEQEQAATGKPYAHVIENDIRLDAYLEVRAMETRTQAREQEQRMTAWNAQEKLSRVGVRPRETVITAKVGR